MNEISNCDIFILIVTYAVVHPPPWIEEEDWIEKEFSQAERFRKRIIPCIKKDVSLVYLKQWKLWERIRPRLQIEKFEDNSSLIGALDRVVLEEYPISPKKSTKEYSIPSGTVQASQIINDRGKMPSIFISFSIRDALDIAQYVYKHYQKKGYNVFLPTEEIPSGHHWRDEIKRHVEECDIFLLIATYSAIGSQEVAKEIEEAKQLGKRIIPCRHSDIDWSDLKELGLDLAQVLEFDSKEELIRKLETQLRREFRIA